MGKSPVASLVRCVPSEIYFARVLVGGKLIRRSFKTVYGSRRNRQGIAATRPAAQSGGSAQPSSGGKLKPDSNAQGPHTVFKVDPKTGEVTKYETVKPQTNPKNESLGIRKTISHTHPTGFREKMLERFA
jgi:hypothetical protein